MRSYWRAAPAPRYAVLFALPLLLLYEVLAFSLSQDAYAGVRNGADVLLKSLFVWLGGRHGLAIFGALLAGVGLVLVWRDVRKGGKLEGRVFAGMLLESAIWAVVLAFTASYLTGLVLRGVAALPLSTVAAEPTGLAQFGLGTQLTLALGAGLYEELLFRVLLVGVLGFVARTGFGWGPWATGVFAVIGSALIFSGFHYIGPYGDPLQLSSFAFRAIAGLCFSALYVTRGFGITAWSHAIYDVLVILRVLG